MFKLADPKQTYSYPVTIHVPAGDGKTAPQEFTAQFKLLPADEVDKELKQNDIKFVASVLFGWEGIADHHGKPLKFNATNRDRLAQIGYFSYGLYMSYTRFANGLPAKNSEAPLVT